MHSEATVCLQDTGVFSKKSEAKSAQEMMMTNPDIMMNMMKQNLSGFLPQARAPCCRFGRTACCAVPDMLCGCVDAVVYGVHDAIWIFAEGATVLDRRL